MAEMDPGKESSGGYFFPSKFKKMIFRQKNKLFGTKKGKNGCFYSCFGVDFQISG
jgi:hypothetical protein